MKGSPDTCRQPSWPSLLRNSTLFGLCMVALIMLLLQAALHVAMASRNLASYKDLTFPESALVDRAMSLLQGEPLYRDDIFHWPHRVSIYGPMTYYPPALLTRLAGVEDGRFEQARQIYIAGRAISFVAGISILLWIWAMARLAGLAGFWRFLAMLFFFCAYRIIEMWPCFRPDFPMLAFGLWAWFIALRWRMLWASAFAAAFYAMALSYKHTAALSALSLFVWLLADRRFRHAACFAVVFILLAGAQFVVLQLKFGDAWYLNTVRSLHAPLFLSALYGHLIQLPIPDLIPLGGGLAALIAAPRLSPQLRPLCWGFGLSFLAAELLVIRAGSNLYYYLEPHCWGTVMAAAAIRASLANLRGNFRRISEAMPISAIFMLSVAAIPLASLSIGLARNLPLQYYPQANLYQLNPRLARLLEKTTEPVLLCEGYLFFYTKSPSTLMDSILLSAWTQAGKGSDEELVAMVVREDFGLVVLSWDLQNDIPIFDDLPFMPKQAIDALKMHYKFVGKHRQYYVYSPKSG